MDLAENADGEKDRMVSVFFSCLQCGKTEEIRVHRWKLLPRKVYWECHVCLSEDRRSRVRTVE